MHLNVNYIDSSERTFFEQTSFITNNLDDLWTSNGTISTDPTDYLDFEYGSLKLNPSNVSNFVQFNHHSSVGSVPSQYALTTDVDGNDFIESFMWVKPTKNCTLYLQTILTEIEFDASTSEFTFVDPFTRVIGGEGILSVDIGGIDIPTWQLIRAIPVAIPENGRWSIEVKLSVVFSTLTGALLNIARPTAHTSQRFLLGEFLQRTMLFVPEIFLESNFANYSTNNPTYPLSRFMDVITNAASDIYNQAISFDYLDSASGGSYDNLFTASRFVDPRVCDTSYLFWLAQFRGRPILVTFQPSTEGIGWQVFTMNSSLLTGLDPATGLPIGSHVLGTGATNLGGLPAGIEAFARWQVETGYYGHNAGTVNAMMEAIKRNLTGTQTVNFTLGTNQINFTTIQSETFGTVSGNVGSPSSTVIALIEPARPLGMIVTHILT